MQRQAPWAQGGATAWPGNRPSGAWEKSGDSQQATSAAKTDQSQELTVKPVARKHSEQCQGLEEGVRPVLGEGRAHRTPGDQASQGAGQPGLSWGLIFCRGAMSMLTGRGPCFLAAPQAKGIPLCSTAEGKGPIQGCRTQLSTHWRQFSRISLGLLSAVQVQKEALWFLEIASAGQVSEQRMRRAELCFPGRTLRDPGQGWTPASAEWALQSPNACVLDWCPQACREGALLSQNTLRYWIAVQECKNKQTKSIFF